MRNSIQSIKLAAAMSWLLALSVSVQAGLAYEPAAFDMLQAETAMSASNTSEPATPSKKKQAKPDMKLHGGVMKKGDEVQSQDNTATGTSSQGPIELDANAAGAQLQSEAATGDEQKFQLAAAKPASGARMTSGDYRNLQIGTCGYFTAQTSKQINAQIIAVCAGSPAEAAGIKKADVVLYSESLPNVDPRTITQSTWKFNFEHPGTPNHLTLKRGDMVTNYTLTRINIEDLPSEHDRKVYEKNARLLGHPARERSNIRSVDH